MNDGNNIHRLKKCLCEDWNSREYENCCDGATVIDSTSVTGYAVGDKILGDLETYGWVVLRGANVTEIINEKMTSISTKGKWKSISTEVHCFMKYNFQSKLPATWSDAELVRFWSPIESHVLNKYHL